MFESRALAGMGLLGTLNSPEHVQAPLVPLPAPESLSAMRRLTTNASVRPQARGSEWTPLVPQEEVSQSSPIASLLFVAIRKVPVTVLYSSSSASCGAQQLWPSAQPRTQPSTAVLLNAAAPCSPTAQPDTMMSFNQGFFWETTRTRPLCRTSSQKPQEENVKPTTNRYPATKTGFSFPISLRLNPLSLSI